MKNIEDNFVPYAESLELKKLGFNEECFGTYLTKHSIKEGKLYAAEKNCDVTPEYDEDGYENFTVIKNSDLTNVPQYLAAPLFSQAFEFFREKYNLRSFVDTRVYNVDSPYQWIYDYQIKMGDGITTQPFYSGDFDSYKEAELECLRKLIEIANEIQKSK